MVKCLFVIFYLCVVMFLKLGHQLANVVMVVARMRDIKRKLTTKLISPNEVYIDFPLHGQSAIANLRDNLRSHVSEISLI